MPKQRPDLLKAEQELTFTYHLDIIEVQPPLSEEDRELVDEFYKMAEEE